jgi:hypothetical protein
MIVFVVISAAALFGIKKPPSPVTMKGVVKRFRSDLLTIARGQIK